jgi:hypothetical protein
VRAFQELSMKRYRYFQPLLLAFYSKSLYRDVGQNWRGVGFSYLWLLAILCFLAFTFRFVHFVNHGLNELQPIVAQLPAITIKQGEVTIDKAGPYLIKNTAGDQVIAIIDTTGQYTSLDNNTSAIALLTKNKLFMRRGTHIKEYDLSTVHGTYDADNVKHLLNFAYVVAVIISAIILPLYFFAGVLQTLFYAVLVKLCIDTGFTYKTLCRLAAIALTPTFILAIVISLFTIHVPYIWVIYIVLAIGYLLFGVNANWETEPALEKATHEN